jgi:hypothetical protein
MYYLVVFRARSETMKFASLLSSYGVKSVVVNTPRQIAVSCGISVKVDANALNICKQILSRRQFWTFGGIYLMQNDSYVQQ